MIDDFLEAVSWGRWGDAAACLFIIVTFGLFVVPLMMAAAVFLLVGWGRLAWHALVWVFG